MTNKIKDLAKKYLPKMQEIRRELHQNPELGFNEIKTAEIIKRELTKLGIPYNDGIAKTGVVGIIKGKYPGKTVMLRADMDALPIFEETNFEFKSKIDGCMHACGHDGHVAGLLGAAMILKDLQDNLHGNIKLLFQPAEEGPGGAEPMVKEGVLENPKVDIAFGCHIWPALKGGTINTKAGAMMSHPSEFEITILGKGGHGSLPEIAIDPVVIGAEIVMAIQNIKSRMLSSFEPAVISVTTIHSGTAQNIIPDTLTLSGTIRSFSEDLSGNILNKIENLVKGITSAYGAKYTMKKERQYIALSNYNNATDFLINSAKDIVGADNVCEMKYPLMGSEDFSYFAKEVPSCFFLVGMKDNQADIESILHHPRLNWDDRRLEISSSVLAKVAYDFLEQNK